MPGIGHERYPGQTVQASGVAGHAGAVVAAAQPPAAGAITGWPPVRRSSAWLCLAGLALSAPAASGHESVFDLSLESLMELQVSVASPFESNIASTAASISVLRPIDWERRAVRSVEEALEQIPSVAVYSSLNSARMVAVRGYANERSPSSICVRA